MEKTTSDDIEKLFKFSFNMLTNPDLKYELEVPIMIPFNGCAMEFLARIVDNFFIPVYVEEDLKTSLLDFIESETYRFYDERAAALIIAAQSEDFNSDEIISDWKKVFEENTVMYGGLRSAPDDSEVFAMMYHKLVHSPALEAVLQREHTYEVIIQDIINERDRQISDLTAQQTEEMSRAVEEVNIGLTEAEVTALVGKHLDEHGMEVARWDSELGGIQESQKREYKEWLTSLLEKSFGSINRSPSSAPLIPLGPNVDEFSGENQRMQESFTIHLGSQLKQMYNIRILVADPMDFCKHRTLFSEDTEPQPQRLQTALSLYSNDLSGLVMLTDNCLGSFSGVTKDFIKVCEKATELHFSNVETQLEKIRESVKEGVQWRKEFSTLIENNLLTTNEQQLRKSDTKYLQTGDVYMTKHSNLSEVHVVFHMVVDDSIKSNDINSRHPGILGLRNIIKCCCSNDITTLTVPLLLSHDITNEMTLNWCTKRAELVYKCVKGFMIEMASWGGSELKNLQFLVPNDITEEFFSALSSMLPSIFRVSNPLVLKASSSPQNVKTKSDKKSMK